jgi:predicted small metal-binding protein
MHHVDDDRTNHPGTRQAIGVGVNTDQDRRSASSGGDRTVGSMKTMTCKELGGACDLELRGDSADEVIKKQDAHLKEAVAGGDATHADALAAMKARWKRPISGMKWYRSTKAAFATRPED